MVSPTTDRRLGLVGNVAIKAPVTVLAATNIALSGQQTIDGIAVLAVNAAGVADRVLCIGQTDATQNGIWDVSTSAWSRSKDADGNYDFVQGTTVQITKGSSYAGTYWKLDTAAPFTIGSVSLSWSQALSTSSTMMTFLQAGTGAVPRSMQDKSRDIACVLDFGAIGDGTSHPLSARYATLAAAQAFYPFAVALTEEIDRCAIQAAVNSSAHGILVPGGGRTYMIDKQITVATPGLRLYTEEKGMYSPYSTTFKWNGATDATAAMVKVSSGTHGVEIDGLRFDANLAAGICVFVEALAGGSTHQPALRNLYFTNYTSRGVVLGENNIATVKNGQMQTPRLDRLYWGGGTVGAIGLLINAQNCEWAVSTGLYFDPQPGKEHLNHVYAYAGGFNVQGLLTTRATDYAVYSNGSQIVVNGWRLEDRYAFKTAASLMEGPCTITGMLSRGGSTLAADHLIEFNGITSELVLQGARLQGSVAIGATDARYVSAQNVNFTAVGAGFIFSGPQNQSGHFHDVANGIFNFRGGTAPQLRVKSAAGTDWGGWDGVGFRAKTGTAAMVDGFINIPAAAGVPSGTPTAVAGTVPLYFNTNTNDLYAYNGAWKKVTLA